MFLKAKTDSNLKHWAISIAAAVMLSACGGGTSDDSVTSGSAVEQFEREGDHAIGSMDAPVVVVEYASVVCPACANWHNSVYPELKEKYIDPGHVRFVFREFPTQPERLAYAGFTIANCADESRFLDNISLQFKRQRALLGAQDRGKAYEELARASGLSVEEYEACLADEAWQETYNNKVKTAQNEGINSTPTFVINGNKQKVYLIEDFDAVLEPLLKADSTESSGE